MPTRYSASADARRALPLNCTLGCLELGFHGSTWAACSSVWALTDCGVPLRLQQWDINEEVPAEVEGPFHVAVATNVLHTGNCLKSARSGAPPPIFT